MKMLGTDALLTSKETTVAEIGECAENCLRFYCSHLQSRLHAMHGSCFNSCFAHFFFCFTRTASCWFVALSYDKVACESSLVLPFSAYWVLVQETEIDNCVTCSCKTCGFRARFDICVTCGCF